MRLDIYLHEYKNVRSRTLATRLIKSGVVFVNGTLATSPAQSVYLQDTVDVRDHELFRYVSRAGLKLEAALKYFKKYGVYAADAICLDIGSSTGGFTDCLIQYGAKKVYAVDVGTHQLDMKLRTDPEYVDKITLFEKTDIRDFDLGAHIHERLNLVVADISFISLAHIIPVLKNVKTHNEDFSCRTSAEGVGAEVLDAKGEDVKKVEAKVTDTNSGPYFILLIKPQFEAGKGELNRQGIVKNEQTLKQIIAQIELAYSREGFEVIDCIPSPILGGDGVEGNQEFLMLLR